MYVYMYVYIRTYTYICKYVHMHMQENHQTVKEIEAELQRKNEDNSSLCKKNEELVSKLQVHINIFRMFYLNRVYTAHRTCSATKKLKI